MLSLPPSGCEQLIQNALTPPPPPDDSQQLIWSLNLTNTSNGCTRLDWPTSCGISSSFFFLFFLRPTHTHARKQAGPGTSADERVVVVVRTSPRLLVTACFVLISRFPPTLPTATPFLLQLQDTAGGSVGNMVDVCPFQ